MLAMENDSIRTINFYDLQLHTGTFNDVAQWIIHQSLIREAVLPTIIAHVNVHNYYELIKNQPFKRELQQNSFLLFDGIGLKGAAFIAGLGWLPDLNGTDLFPLIMGKGSEKQLKIYCLGTELGVIERAVNKIRYRFPRILVTGYRHGYFKPNEEKEVVEEINASKADMLIIGMGFITQEKFALRYRKQLDVKVIWNVGGLFDIVSEEKPRTPLFMRKLRLEWLFRLLLEPRRRWKRIFVSAPYFFVNFLMYRVRNIIRYITGTT